MKSVFAGLAMLGAALGASSTKLKAGDYAALKWDVDWYPKGTIVRVLDIETLPATPQFPTDKIEVLAVVLHATEPFDKSEIDETLIGDEILLDPNDLTRLSGKPKALG
jgi:hypothetical protein